MESTHTVGIGVTAEQLPLLRDLIVLHALDVHIRDTQHTELLDDQWKPWVRRIRPQLTHCKAGIWVWTPCYAWPDHHAHPRIRTIIAEQLQTCIHIAVLCGARGIVLPIEHASQHFQQRIAYYIALLHDQLSNHSLELVLALEPTANRADVEHLLATMTLSCRLLSSDSTGTSDEYTHETMLRMAVDSDESKYFPIHGQSVVIDATENSALLRKKIEWLVDSLKRVEETHPSSEATAPADADETEEVDTADRRADADSPVISSDDEIS